MTLAFGVSWIKAQTPSTSLLPTALDSVVYERDTLLDLFKWVARTVRYCEREDTSVRSMAAEEFVNEALMNGSGVCQHFAELYAAAARASGYHAHVINGYTDAKDTQGHSWVAIRTAQGWREFDPTWGAGYLMDSIYHPRLNLRWFNLSRDSMRTTHFPMEPVWAGSLKTKVQQDSAVAFYLAMDTLERAKVSLAYLTQQKATPIVLLLQDHQRNTIVFYTWTAGALQLNEAIASLNVYVERKHQYFRKPRWSDERINGASLELVRLAEMAQATLAEVDRSHIHDQEQFQIVESHAGGILQRCKDERSIAVRYLETWRPIRSYVLLSRRPK